jgi:hypothetical protein
MNLKRQDSYDSIISAYFTACQQTLVASSSRTIARQERLRQVSEI